MRVKDEQQRLIPALERGLMILMELNRHHREMSFAEIVKRVGFPQSTTYRTVQTLEHMGFLRHHPVTGLYSLGVNVLRLGFEYVASLDVVQVGQPVIEALCEVTGCSSHIAIRDGRDAVYVARVGATNATVRRVSVGTRLPLHRTGLGRMLLAELSYEEFETLYPSGELLDNKPGTPANRDALWELVQEDRRRGYVIADSYFHFGISSIVYPLYNQDGAMEGVVSIMVPVHEIPEDAHGQLQERVAEAAANISSMLGHG
ncbi:IclR family transcriptional regulator [Halomonas sp. M1]|uniref:IclR family transcriptional regulator n=1 Tax=Halomonas sp. M1 TaxID=3035470 RepID=UPI0024863838|nr:MULTISPECIES: IclR family transcriptional regulator [unclassified Halomonas]MDP3535156.1 IclR family transcriptional regulator [Halomonas sp.]WFE70009.1 IclR family transcriptional regulator [Halomonas sp. M1]